MAEKTAEELQAEFDEKVKLAAEAIINPKLEQAKAEFKEKIDKAYGERDDLKKLLEKIEADKVAAERKAAEESGDLKRIHEMDMQAARKKLEEAETRELQKDAALTKYTRDLSLRQALATLKFQNANAIDMAFNSIVNSLVKNDKGEWVHTSGVSIQEAVDAFGKDKSNDFLFSAKASSGSGTENSDPPPQKREGSLFSLSQAEVLALAEAGKL